MEASQTWNILSYWTAFASDSPTIWNISIFIQWIFQDSHASAFHWPSTSISFAPFLYAFNVNDTKICHYAHLTLIHCVFYQFIIVFKKVRNKSLLSLHPQQISHCIILNKDCTLICLSLTYLSIYVTMYVFICIVIYCSWIYYSGH